MGYGTTQQGADRDPDTLMRGTLASEARVTAAEVLQLAYPLTRQQPLPGPDQLQPQPAGDGDDDDEGTSDYNNEAARRAEAAGAQQTMGKRKRKNSKKKGAKFKERRK
jgi:hypothetical protein